MSRSRVRIGVWLLLGGLGVGMAASGVVPEKPREVSAVSAPDGTQIEFGRQVRPILVKHCLACHGFDPSTREADLRLDTFEFATASRRDGAAIVPGDAGASQLLHRVSDPDPDVRMPPKGPGLKPEEIETLRAWIEQGASYEPHWSLRPLREVSPPAPRDGEWSANPIDRFIFDGIAEAGLEPAPEADRRTLLRRLCVDLTGLPPTPEQTEAFLSNTSEDAYGRLVDSLLASPRYGERWARHWLDLMRYAETYAHEFDYPIRHAYQYRDYVIRAFNADVPYDEFVTEHLAGDLLPDPRRNPEHGFNESIIGTGFWWLSQGTHSPVDVTHDEAERIDNQIDVLSKTFLATTVSCARCHDHKFDPVLTQEYYSLASFVQSSRRQEAYLDPDGKIRAAVDEMTEVDREVRRVLDSSAWPPAEARADGVADLLLAVGEVLHGEPSEGETPPAARSQTLADFDSLTYEGWSVTGDAFTDRPTTSGPDGLDGGGTAVGAGFANTHRRLEGEGSVQADLRVGSITSEPFTIDRRWMHFLIGGGDHRGKTGLRVVVDGRAVAEATGHNSLNLRRERFDLDEFQGREATIEIFDNVTGGWGNIRVDEIVLSDEPNLGNPAAREVAAVAEERGLKTDTLAAWTAAVQSGDVPPELTAWLDASASVHAEPAAEVEFVPTGAGASPLPADADPLFNFADSSSDFAEWFVSGWAFGEGTTAAGGFRAPAHELRIADTTCADSGRLSPTLMGTMRSPTFEITSPYLAVLTRGSGTLRVIIDGYTLDEYNALLWNNVKLDVGSDDWQWHVHDLRKWVGHRAHYEIIDDRQDAAIEVVGAVWRDEYKAPGSPPATIANVTTETGTLAAYTQRLASAMEHALSGESDDPAACVLASWASGRGLIPAPAAELRSRFAAAEASCPAPMRAMAMEDGTGEDGYVYIRGDHRQHGQPAPRGFLGALSDSPEIDPGPGSGRLALASKLLDPSDPMPARVMVNRVWHHLMGRGIVETTDDFGLLGATPTDPDLLDHLAWRFSHELGWSVKALIREIVTSRTYRAASVPLPPKAEQIDPLNHLWSVREPRRLDGETVRDAILAASGGLDTTMYGPSVPVHLTPFMTGRGRPGKSGPLDGDGRRSIYLEVRRNFLSPMMQAFDSPNPHQSVGKRNVSNVPAQSLILLNDPFVVEQAKKLAGRLIKQEPDADARLGLLYLRVLAREPDRNEARLARAFLQQQAADAGVDDWADDPAVWADLCHAVLNLKEFTFIE